jgi:hypothetical protein
MTGNELQPRTLELIGRLFAAKWFENVGQDLPGNVYAARSWAEAAEFAKDPEEVFHLARGEYTERLSKTARRRYQQWNNVVALIKRAVHLRTNERIDALTTFLEPSVQTAVRDHARWTILHACVESEYLDVMPAGFFLSLTDWYAAGRFPCGWFGKYPQGVLAIY